MAWSPPDYADFKAFFARDFYFAQDSDPNNLDFVTNNDITRAITEAGDNFIGSVFSSDSVTTNAYMYLAAFCLVRNIQMSTKGLSSTGKFLVNANSVGGVSQSFTIPEQYMKDLFLSSLVANSYGQRYLEMIIPYLTGNVFVARGRLSSGCEDYH